MSDFGTFDFIVVGAGSAGCVIANRLSANGRHSVLLLEAGGRDSNPWIHVPIGYAKTFANPRVNWMYETEPEAELNNRRIYQPRGKVLGGTSSINGLVYVRGQPEDFDTWAQMGNVGWSYSDVLPYFKKAESYEGGESETRGGSGPLSVSNPREPHELCEAFIRAGEQYGLPRREDFNGRDQEGVGYFQTTSRNGQRCSTAVAYLRPALKRRNLRVVTGAHTHRLLFEGKRASGVEFIHQGKLQTAKAGREVILSAGAIGSPQLLELSGIGQAELLRQHGIPMVHELSGVGENLQDHLQVRMVFRCTKAITLNDQYRNLLRRAGIGLRYALQRKGPLAVSAGYATAFYKSAPQLETPDIEIHFIIFSTDKMGAALHPYSGFTASICHLRPQSRGTVHVKSASASEHPSIRANYLSVEEDRRANVEGLKVLRSIMQQPAMKEYVAQEIEPGPDCASDAQWLAYARMRGSTIYHPSGTCMMGHGPGAVVSPALKVHGLESLRVADASIMPRLVSANCNAAIIMIGEKVSDLILDDVR